MWRLIRGQGLSYGYNIYPNPVEGLLYLTFYRSTNVVAAYKEAKSIVVSIYFKTISDKIFYLYSNYILKFVFTIYHIITGSSYFRK